LEKGGEMKSEFSKLFEPGFIGTLRVKNRIIMSPMITHYATREGGVSEQQIDYYAARSKGGAGIIVIENTYTNSHGPIGRLLISSDAFIPGLSKLAEAIHKNGGKAVIELNIHRGRVDKEEPVSASAIPDPVTGIPCKALSTAEIEKLVNEFGESAGRAKEAGFDGIMIHGGNSYLVPQFLSTVTNKRTDEYGGDLQGRAKLAVDLAKIARMKTGPDYPIIYRLTVDERGDDGYTLSNGAIVCKWLEAAGVNAIDAVASGRYHSACLYIPPGYNAPRSMAIKKAVRIPVSAPGRIDSPALAERLLVEGAADFVTLGRALIADPEFANKAATGRASEIRRCLACSRCQEHVSQAWDVRLACTVNPAVGRERQFEPRQARKAKRVLVIGGGPAGMQAALACSERGHRVTLWEEGPSLGGQLNIAHLPPDKDGLKSILSYLQDRLAKSNVNMEMDKKATADAVLEFAPESVILAIGARLLVPDIQGLDSSIVVSGWDVLSGKVHAGKNVIVIGGGRMGCELADFLVQKGTKVVLVEVLPALYSEGIANRHSSRTMLLERLSGSGVKSYLGVKGEKITDYGMEIEDAGGRTVALEADGIVLAVGSVANTDTLSAALEGKNIALYKIGDCVKPRQIREAIRDGAETALNI
jgi:2,4-dienoyl-CoA reductase-like NADH-dependent reductase (Old Yellow Enzyme family)/thioredoxin reductase